MNAGLVPPIAVQARALRASHGFSGFPTVVMIPSISSYSEQTNTPQKQKTKKALRIRRGRLSPSRQEGRTDDKDSAMKGKESGGRKRGRGKGVQYEADG